jgi:CIDE-N domain
VKEQPTNNFKYIFQIKDVTRNIKKAVVASTLQEMREKSASKFGRSETELPNIHLDSDGTEIDDEDYFQTLEPNAELIAVFPGEKWEDVSTSLVTFISISIITIILL